MYMAKESIKLGYAPRAPRFRRQCAALILGLAAIGLITAVSTWGSELLNQWRYLVAQRSMLHHALSPDMVVFEMEGSAPELLTNQSLYQPWNGQGGYAPAAFYFPDQFASFLPAPTKINGVLFLHHRKNPAGADRLVVVWISVLNMDTALTTDIVVSAAAYEPASLKPGSRLTLIPGTTAQLSHTPYWPPLRLWAGQPDPRDPTHFTIPYSLEVGSGTIDGWLRGPDQDHPTEHIVLDARDGPLHTIHGL